MAEMRQSVEIYRSYDGNFEDKEMNELNKMLEKLGINCKVTEEVEDDGTTMCFRKVDR